MAFINETQQWLYGEVLRDVATIKKTADNRPQPKQINVFQLVTDKGVSYVTTASPRNPNRPHSSWRGKHVATFKCTIKPGVVLKSNGLVKYVPFSKIKKRKSKSC